MTYVVEVLRQEHRNIEKLLRVLERELSVFDRGDRPNYEAVLGVIDYFKDYPNSCHHPKEDIIFEKLKSRDPVTAANPRCAVRSWVESRRTAAKKPYCRGFLLQGIFAGDFLTDAPDRYLSESLMACCYQVTGSGHCPPSDQPNSHCCSSEQKKSRSADWTNRD